VTDEEEGKHDNAVEEALTEYRRDRTATFMTELLGGLIYLCRQFNVKGRIVPSP
jgi:hypothetical protein